MCQILGSGYLGRCFLISVACVVCSSEIYPLYSMYTSACTQSGRLLGLYQIVVFMIDGPFGKMLAM